jgi:hypothetical protein
MMTSFAAAKPNGARQRSPSNGIQQVQSFSA